MVKSKKYGNIITTARELFWKHGFRRVTIREICEKAGVSKMTFYKFFPNKIELAKTVFEHEVEKGMNRFSQLMDENISGEEMLKEIILLKVEGTNDISHEFMEDFYMDNEPKLKNFVEEKTKDAWTRLMREWTRAQEKGIFRKDFKPEFLFRVSNKIQELLKDEELAAMYDSTQDFILEFTRFIAYGISKR
jgi:AcrR family transcriptional regulator